MDLGRRQQGAWHRGKRILVCEHRRAVGGIIVVGRKRRKIDSHRSTEMISSCDDTRKQTFGKVEGMQDRYVGDVGDFGKYALLRALAGVPGPITVRLAIVWCRFPDESH